ncbi:MAG TPA: PAS domain-containing protein [Planctomycetota bacterium]|nr:PAS domain-containing protein [Planctomycetota bacterium]
MLDDSLLLSQLMDHLPDAVFYKDLQGRFLRINRVLASWHGLADPAEAVGKSEADFYSRGFARATRETEEAILKTGAPILDQEGKFVGRDGKSRWVSLTLLPLRDEGGSIVGTLGIWRDIKGVKRAEEKARDSDALYQSLIESLPQCIFRKDVEGRYVYVNQKLCALQGLVPKDFLGKTDFDVNPPALATKYRRDDQWVMSHQKVFEAVEEVKAKRKKIRIRISKTPVYDSSGRVVGVQGVFSPVAESRSRKGRN